jgi:hypothetical protein
MNDFWFIFSIICFLQAEGAKMKIRIMQFSVLIVSLIITSCISEHKPMYGKDFNDERFKANIPAIPENWKESGSNSKSTNWYNPDFNILFDAHTPFHASKYIEIERGELKLEQDIYYGSEDVRWDDSTQRESISITVFYEGVSSNLDNIELNRQIFITNKSVFMEEISLEEAEKVLMSWGIEYP